MLPDFLCPAGTFIAGTAPINTFKNTKNNTKAMPANKNALIRYKTIDKCLRNRYRRWTIDDLVEACSDALYDMEGIGKGVSMRTAQGDIQIMRSDKLGYNAPIEVYDNKFYRYADPDYSINSNPLDGDDFELVEKAVSLINNIPNGTSDAELKAVLTKLKSKLLMLL